MTHLGHQLREILEAHTRTHGYSAIIKDPQDIQGILCALLDHSAHMSLSDLEGLRPRRSATVRVNRDFARECRCMDLQSALRGQASPDGARGDRQGGGSETVTT